MSSQYDVLAAGSRAAAQKKRLKLGSKISLHRSRMNTEVVEVLRMFCPRQNSVPVLYFTSRMMGVVGTAGIEALEMEISAT